MGRRVVSSILVAIFAVGFSLPMGLTLTLAQGGIIPIGAVQGPVPQGPTCRAARSPFAPPTGPGSGTMEVRIKDVITQHNLAGTSTGGSLHSFFIQNNAATADGDPFTSDGVFVSIGSAPDIARDDGLPGRYTPAVGDEIVLRGFVTEFFFFTQITSPRLVQIARA